MAADVVGSVVDPDEPLMAAGMDSLSSVEFRNRLTAEAGAGIKFPWLGGCQAPFSIAFQGFSRLFRVYGSLGGRKEHVIICSWLCSSIV